MSEQSVHRALRDCKDEAEVDAMITTALARTDVIPDLCSWYGGSHGVHFRIETHIGRYAERRIDPLSDIDGIQLVIEGASRDLEAKRSA